MNPVRALAMALVMLPLAAIVARPAAAAKTAELPRQTVDTKEVAPSGPTRLVRKGGDLQAALDAATPGSVITLEAGATFAGPFTLPDKPGAEWIVVRTSAKLPPAGGRIDPAAAGVMPQLVAADAPVLVAAKGAHHWRFVGIEIRPAATGERVGKRLMRSVRRLVSTAPTRTSFTEQTLVRLGVDASSLEELPHHIIFDRCYLHGDPQGGARRGIALNGRHLAVVDSVLTDFKAVGVDSQAILGWNGPGPFKIENNRLEGAGENVMFGGGTPSIPDLVPADIEILRNHFTKPLSWKIGDPSYAGTPWTVKNLFELKNARRVRVEGNLFEHSWVHAQDGFALLLTVRTEDDAVPWAVVEDVLFANNVVRNTASGIYILGVDDNSVGGHGRGRRITLRNNLFDGIGGARWGGGGRLFQVQQGAQDVVIDHNTGLQAEQLVWGGDGRAHTGFVFTNNIAPHNTYGIIGSGHGTGLPSLERYFPGAVIRGNVMAGGAAALYPPGNFFPGSLDDVGFVNRARADYRLKGSSPYRGVATDGADAGVDFKALEAARQ